MNKRRVSPERSGDDIAIGSLTALRSLLHRATRVAARKFDQYSNVKGKNMPFCIKRFDENPDGQTMVLGRYNDYRKAELALKEELATYPKSGRNENRTVGGRMTPRERSSGS
jgi:hypothetical protein